MDGNVTSLSGSRPGIMTDYDYTMAMIPKSVLGTLSGLMGIFTNSICIHVFLKMKGNDAVSIGFLGLASSDLTHSIFTVFSDLFLGLNAFGQLYGVENSYRMVYGYFINASICVGEVTILITLYLAIARCLCVAMPLQFRHSNIFTPAHTRGYITGAWVFSVGVYIPILANMGVREVYNPVLNTTKYILWYTEERERIKDGVFMLTQTIVPFSTQVILFLCIVVMVNALVQVKNFRQGNSNSKDDFHADDHESGVLDCRDDVVKKKKASGKLSGKELQAVKQVVLISVIFMVCNIPMILVSVASAVVPGFDFNNADGSNRRYVLLYITSHVYKKLFEQINSSINVFVYYRFNSRFRECFNLHTFICCPRLQD